MRVLVTTQHRVARADATHGHLLELDWERGRVVRRIEAPPLWSHFGRRDRGGRRGLRGITFFRGLIWVASCDVVYGLDPRSLEPERCVSHRYMAHIHEIEATDEGIWVTSTGGNGIFWVMTCCCGEGAGGFISASTSRTILSAPANFRCSSASGNFFFWR